MIAADKAVQAALKSAETAVNKAENAAERRFASVNEFRQTLSDQTKSFVTTDRFEGLDVRINDMRDRITVIESLTRGMTSERIEQRADTGARNDADFYRSSGTRGQMALAIAAFSSLISIIAVIVVIVLHK